MAAALRRPLLLALGGFAAFVAVLVAAYRIPFVGAADAHAVDGFVGLQRPLVVSLADPIAHLGDPAPFALAGLLLCVVALRTNRPRHAAAVVALLAIANVSAQVLQSLLAYSRGEEVLSAAHLDPQAFPSGHATASMSIALAAILVAPPARRAAVAAAGALFTLLVCVSLLTLGWHYPSDVVGGYLLAGTVAAVVAAALRGAAVRWPERTGREVARSLGRAALGRTALLFTALAALAVAAVTVREGRDIVRYADGHTTLVAAVLLVALTAAAVPAALAAVSARRG
jgi:membrane-associated phospholipid phosphatase